MAWIYLLVAGLFEIGWPLGLKLSQVTVHKAVWILFAGVSMIASGLFLWLAQKSIPMGTAYAVWTGIGAVGAFVVGILLFKDQATIFKVLSVTFIIIGIVGLKLSYP
ncbi:MAG: multidrug efflux SMR transporter [wastewater metagenome]|nr:multidrug efflux SMR transporter [Candidatus Loosdrechtia aerotolerans]